MSWSLPLGHSRRWTAARSAGTRPSGERRAWAVVVTASAVRLSAGKKSSIASWKAERARHVIPRTSRTSMTSTSHSRCV